MSVIIPRFYTENLLERAATTYAVTVGADNALYPMSNAFQYSNRAALPVTDESGNLTINITVDRIGVGWGTEAWGVFLGTIPSKVFIFGVQRHNPALHRFTGGYFKLTASGTVLVDHSLDGLPINKNWVFDLPVHDGDNYTLELTGLQPDTVITIPDLYIGNYEELGGIEYNYDPYIDKPHIKEVRLQKGGGYDIVNFIQFEARPSFKHIGDEHVATLNYMRELVFEQNRKFYYQFDPALQHELYLVRQVGGFASAPIVVSKYRDMKLNLKEWLGD